MLIYLLSGKGKKGKCNSAKCHSIELYCHHLRTPSYFRPLFKLQYAVFILRLHLSITFLVVMGQKSISKENEEQQMKRAWGDVTL